MKKTVVVLTAAVLGITAFFLYKAKSGKDLIVYDYATVSRGDIKVEVSASGTIQPVNVVSVGTQVSGIIEKVFVDYNSEVNKGDLIAQLETFTLEEDLKEAKATLTDAKSKLAQKSWTQSVSKNCLKKTISPNPNGNRRSWTL